MSIKISNNSYQSHINLASLHTTRIDRIASSESEFPIQMIHIHEAIIIVMMMPNSKSWVRDTKKYVNEKSHTYLKRWWCKQNSTINSSISFPTFSSSSSNSIDWIVFILFTYLRLHFNYIHISMRFQLQAKQKKLLQH